MPPKLDIMAFGAHPDDVELSCGATVIKHVALGKTVGVVDLTKGELGTRGTAEIREQEAAAAAKLMGFEVRENLGLPDGFLENSKDQQMTVLSMIRKYRPDIVLANAVQDRHPDHGKAASLVRDSCFLSGLVKLETSWEGKAQEAWRPKAVYHYTQENYMMPDLVVDVSEHFDAKMEAVRAYKSQFYDPDSSDPETKISGENYLDFVEARARDLGNKIGVKYAEGFTSIRPIGVDDLSGLL